MFFAQTTPAKDGDVQVGVLECDAKADDGLILGLKRKINCALAGKHQGVAAEVAVVDGIGGNILVSVGNDFTLQPLSVQGREGLNVADGLKKERLEYAEPVPLSGAAAIKTLATILEGQRSLIPPVPQIVGKTALLGFISVMQAKDP